MGRRICSLDQTHSECEYNLMQILTQVDFFPPNWVKTKKRSLPQFGTIFGRNWWDLFVPTGPFSSDPLALNVDWGTLNVDGGTRLPASSLQFKYWVYGFYF